MVGVWASGGIEMSTIDKTPRSVVVRLLDASTAGAFSEFALLLRGIKASRDRWVLLSFPGMTTLVIGAAAAGQVRLNTWQGALYDALQRRDVAAFFDQLLIFLVII